jgi:hypothetical protein
MERKAYDRGPQFSPLPVTSEVAGSSPVVPAIPLNNFRAFSTRLIFGCVSSCATELFCDQLHGLLLQKRRQVLITLQFPAAPPCQLSDDRLWDDPKEHDGCCRVTEVNPQTAGWAGIGRRPTKPCFKRSRSAKRSKGHANRNDSGTMIDSGSVRVTWTRPVGLFSHILP